MLRRPSQRPAFLLLEIDDSPEELRAALVRGRAFVIQAASPQEAIEILTKVRVKALVTGRIDSLRSVIERYRQLPIATRTEISCQFVLLGGGDSALPSEAVRVEDQDLESTAQRLREL